VRWWLHGGGQEGVRALGWVVLGSLEMSSCGVLLQCCREVVEVKACLINRMILN
jgi:hypothetical protein